MNAIPEITPDDAGTWLDGCHGWHNAYRVVDRATDYGFVIPPEYVDALADYRVNGPGASEGNWEAMIGQGELSDMATDYLQERAPAGYAFVWDCGEFSLIRECQNGDGPCPNACDCGCAMGEYECACSDSDE